VHLVEERPYPFAECRIVVSPRALCGVPRADRETYRGRRRRERSVSEGCNKRVKKVLAASSGGGPSLPEPRVIRLLKACDVRDCLADEVIGVACFRQPSIVEPFGAAGEVVVAWDTRSL
jgi:hypothetical protein